MVQRGEEIAGADRTRDARSTSAISGLDLTRPEAELLQPLPAGSLRVERVR